MNRKIYAKIAAAALVITFLLSSCAFDRNALIGSWDTTSGIVVQFTEDGKIRQVPPQGFGAPTDAPYQFLNDNTIIFIDSQIKLTFKVEGDKLTLDPGGGQQVIVLTRTK